MLSARSLTLHVEGVINNVLFTEIGAIFKKSNSVVAMILKDFHRK